MASEGRRFCENCGTEVSEATNFCPSCGAAQKPDPQVSTGPPPIPEAGRIETPSTPGIPPPPPRSRGRRWIGGLVGGCAVVLLLLVGFVACAAVIGSRGEGEETSGRTFTKDDYAELATDPDSFRGASVDVTGRLIRNPEVRGDTTSFQMFADPENSDWNTLVRTDSAPDGLTSGDTVRIQGTVRGGREGENLMGGTVRSVEVEADSVEVTEEARSKSRP